MARFEIKPGTAGGMIALRINDDSTSGKKLRQTFALRSEEALRLAELIVAALGEDQETMNRYRKYKQGAVERLRTKARAFVKKYTGNANPSEAELRRAVGAMEIMGLSTT